MHGDFSRWVTEFFTNDHGILHQQGRVLLDHDINTQTILNERWQVEAARAAFGGGIAAVPSSEGDSFAILQASAVTGGASLVVKPGIVFADGLLAYLTPHADDTLVTVDGDEGIEWLAKYREPAPTSRAAHEAVILDAWHESLSSFQDTALLESALGGPDTTERVHVGMALRLVPMEADEHCTDLVDRLHWEPQGSLSVTLQPGSTHGDPDCPIEDPGGYRGPEHHLYRVEIAEVDAGLAPMFKWSRFNGGLVGRGRLSEDGLKVSIIANQRAIATSGLTSLYIEVLTRDPERRHWRVVYGARATLANDHEITLGERVYANPGIPSGTDEEFFFRLWDDATRIDGFSGSTAPAHLIDGIQLEFDSGPFRPGDYWTFPVRAGLANGDDGFLLREQSPQGVYRFAAPLAVITWGSGSTATVIEDCRRPFAPLTRRDCCTVRVGDGSTSIGDVRTLQEAIDRLPAAGGTICILPGRHVAGARMIKRKNVTIHGCGPFSKLVAPTPASDTEDAAAVLEILGGEGIRMHDLAIEADDRGPGIFVDIDDQKRGCHGLQLERLVMAAATRSAIEIEGAQDVLIHRCDIAMKDVEGQWPAITIAARDARIERNRVAVVPQRRAVIIARNVMLVDQPAEPAQPPEPAQPAAPPPPPPARPAPPPTDPNGPLDLAPMRDLDRGSGPPLIYSGGLGLATATDAEWPTVLEDEHEWQDSTALAPAPNIDHEEDERPARTRIEERPLLRLQDSGEDPADTNLPKEGDGSAGVSEALAISHAGLGGIWLRGGCRRVQVLDNDIISGIGHGILLGHVDVDEAGPRKRIPWVFGFGDPCAPCLDGNVLIYFPGLPQADKIIPGEKLQQIEIERNRILAMGLAGIGVFGFFETTQQPDLNNFGPMIRVDGLAIRRNRITHCLLRDLAPAPTSMIGRMGYGAITLGYTVDLTIRDNTIEHNSITRAQPVCGVYGLVVDRADVTANVIRNNGRIDSDGNAPLGGVVFGLVRAGELYQRQRDFHPPALVFHENQINTPLGPALQSVIFGRAAVTDNQLSCRTSKGAPAAVALASYFENEHLTFSDNQIVVQTSGKTGAVSPISILCEDSDLLFANNQCQLRASTKESYQASVSLNAKRSALRVTGSRFDETKDSVEVSLEIRGAGTRLVCLNHADHCIAIHTESPVRIKRDNIEHGAHDPADCGPTATAYFTRHPT